MALDRLAERRTYDAAMLYNIYVKLTLADWLMITSVLIAPLLAVQVQRRLDYARERRNRKMWVFHTLMATRAARVSGQHVQALNSIDIEFYGRRILGMRFQSAVEKEVTRKWKEYLDHLGDATVENWSSTGDNLFTELLFAMSRALGYDFDKVTIKKGIYSPTAHGKEEQDLLSIRNNLAKLLSGDTALPMAIVSVPPMSKQAGDQESSTQIQPRQTK